MTNKIYFLKPLLSAVLCLMALAAYAQEKKLLTFNEYMENVKKSNIDYLAEKYNVDIADAAVKASKVFPDPELSVSYANNQNWNLEMGYSVDAELSYKLKANGYSIIVADLNEENEIDYTNKLAIVLGNEGSGVTDQVRELADALVTIKTETVESLNVSVVGSILMYEWSLR